MRARRKSFLYYGSLLLLVVALLCYNVWSYSAGYCTASSLMSLSMPAQFLLAGIFVSIIILLWLRRRNRFLSGGQSCSCGSDLARQWSYCPVCGRKCRP